MSDSEIVIETPDISFDVQEPINNHNSYYQDSIVDSSYVGGVNESADESIVLTKKKHAKVLRSISSDEEDSIQNISAISGPEVEAMHMSVDKSTFQQSCVDMSVDKTYRTEKSGVDMSMRDISYADSSRSTSPDEILAISSDEEEKIGDLNPIKLNSTTPKPQLKLRTSILSGGQGSIYKYAPINVQHSTPIKHFEEPLQISNHSSSNLGLEFSHNKEGSPPTVQDNNINSQDQRSKPIVVSDEEVDTNSKIEVSNAQYLQQKETIQTINFNIIRAKNMVHSVDLTKLPDKGIMLKEKLAHLEKDKQEAEQLLKNMVVTAFKAPKTVAWENLETALGNVQPNTFGKRALQTLNIQKSLTLDTLKELHGSLNTCPDVNTLAPDPPGLKIELMPHQKHALAWLLWREKQKPSGGILADDMGLGKTLTTISLLLNCKQSYERNDTSDDEKVHGKYLGGTLVVCPASLIYQWEAEVKKHVKKGLLTVTLHHGTNREEKTKRLAKQDMVVTTYSLVMRDFSKDGPLFGIKWQRVVLDEAHQVRNHKSQTSIAVCALSSKSRWALTGTPVHNKELDLYALLKFLRCSPFDDLGVWKRWVANKCTGGQDRLNTVLSSLILRRTKQQLVEKKMLNCLPPMHWELIELSLNKEEMKVYQKVLIFSRTLFAQFLSQRAEKEPTSELQNPNAGFFKMHQQLTSLNRVKPIKQHEILVLLLRLRQICCHPALITNMLNKEDNVDDIEYEESEEMNILEQLNDLTIAEDEKENVPDDLNTDQDRVGLAEATRNILNPSHPIFQENTSSSKIKQVLSILDTIMVKKEKIIIISQWTKLLNLVGMHLKKQNIAFFQLDGSVAVSKRMDIVHNINNEVHPTKVLLLSLTAGGVGLNLVGANNLLLLDLHWNPQLELQAQDRIYRVGQTKPVKIYKIITNDTIEQRIKKLQDKKLELAKEVLTGTKLQNQNKLSLDDLKMLFNM